MKISNRTFSIARRTLALSAVLGAGLAVAHAQTAAPAVAQPELNLQLPAASPVATFSSSSAENEVAVAENHFDFLADANAQPPVRRGYGRPRYRGGNTNPDGSAKYSFFGGAGFTVPTQLTHDTNTTSWGIQVGAGRNFNEHVGVDVEFNWDNFGLQGKTLNNQQNLYNAYIALYDATTGGPGDPNYSAPIAGLDGYSHVWSFSLDPIYHMGGHEGLGAYVTGGLGFYHKITTFTLPQESDYCDYIYGCYSYVANAPIDSYTSNAAGLNGGGGLTYKFSRFTNEQLYMDVRYVYIFNPARPGVTVATVGNANIANDYPANSNRTSYIPVKFGIRF
jgi:opacity protein-like surface antigen